MSKKSSLVFVTIVLTAMLCSGCVAKSDYLQKQAEADGLNRNLAVMTTENTSLKEQVDRLNADREKLTTEETIRAIDTLQERNPELEGDKQMLHESIALLKRAREEGLDSAHLTAAAFGEYQPMADNETPEGRTKNRRIAIILLPKEEK
jgi:hypothetical protein